MKYLFICIVFFSISSTIAQEFTIGLVKAIKPRNIGPGGMSGRVTAIDVVISNPDIIYVGTASGGLWKSSSGGIKWEPIFDKQVTSSIGAVEIQQSNPSIIWVGTGEGNPRNSLNGGYGIFKSIDGGKSWKSMGLEKTRHIHRIIVDPTNPNVVYVGAIGSPWGEHPERGVFKTNDGGKTWNKILFANNKTGVADLVMDPSNPNKLIATLWEHKRYPWFFNSGGEGSGLHITQDGGNTWIKLTSKDGLPEGELGRIGVSFAPNKPNIVYAIIEAKKNAFYRSENGGYNWIKVNDKKEIGNRPFYYSEIYVDPQNENRIYSIFTYVNVSEDGGKSFSKLMPAYGVDNGVHPDHHAWWIHPNNGNFIIDGNDGGLNISKDGGKSWRFIDNLPVAQFYHISVDNEIPYNVYGGMQDNGSWRGPAYVWRSQGIRNSYWQEISFGDGFDVIPDKEDSRYGWSMSQEGYLYRYDWQTGYNYIVRPIHPNSKSKLRFNWNSAINIDPFDNNTIYYGSQYVHKSKDKGETWSIISPDLTTNDLNKQNQHNSGGLTIDATGAENYCTILVIEPSVIEEDMLWVGTDDGKIHYTKDGGNSWVDVSKNIKGLPKGSWIEQIKASNKNKGEALLIANDYRRFNYIPYAYRTKNYGKTWQRIVDENDVSSFTLSIVEDIKESNLLFLGTDDGLYLSIDAGKKWTKWTEGFPTTPVKDLVIHPREDDLIIGTFGRAAWIIDDIKPLREIAKNKSIINNTIKLFTPPVSYLVFYQQPTGSRFAGDAIYNGRNREFGVHFTYLINKNKNVDKNVKETTKDSSNIEEDSLKVKWDSLTLNIYEGNRLIRTLRSKIPKENGLHKWIWNMKKTGVDYPSRTIKKRKYEPEGIYVKPGTYKAVLHYGDLTSDTQIEVKFDPRINLSEQILDKVYSSYNRLEKFQQTTADAVRQLVESKNTAKYFKELFKKLDKNNYKNHIDNSTNIIKKIDSLIDGFLGKEDKRQGITDNPNVSPVERLNLAKWYVGQGIYGITLTESTLIKQANDALEVEFDKTNVFFRDDWKKYQDKMNSVDIKHFKNIKSFEIKH